MKRLFVRFHQSVEKFKKIRKISTANAKYFSSYTKRVMMKRADDMAQNIRRYYDKYSQTIDTVESSIREFIVHSQLIASQFKLLKFERSAICHLSTQSSLGEQK